MQSVETRTVDLVALVAAYVAMLEAEGITSPLVERLTLAAVLVDLFALAGIEPPAALVEVIGAA